MLRDVIEDDLPIFFAHQRDPSSNRMAAFPARDWDAFLAHWNLKVLGDASVRKKTIVVSGIAVGNIVCWTQESKRLVGYWLGPDSWGQGVATAALAEFLEHETTRPLHAYVAAHNIGSIRVLEKCGFRRVGTAYANPSDGVDEQLFCLGGEVPAS